MTIIKPSQWTNLGYILFGVVTAPFFPVTLIIPIWKMIETHFTIYEIHQDRIIFKRGVFKVEWDEILFWRIKSLQMNQPFLYRLVNISNLNIRTSDQYVTELSLKGVPMNSQTMIHLRNQTEKWRTEKGTKEFDMYNL